MVLIAAIRELQFVKWGFICLSHIKLLENGSVCYNQTKTYCHQM